MPFGRRVGYRETQAGKTEMALSLATSAKLFYLELR